MLWYILYRANYVLVQENTRLLFQTIFRPFVSAIFRLYLSNITTPIGVVETNDFGVHIFIR
jgi:hypothetical protein